MPSFNKVILIGNLVADPELKQTQSGIPFTNIRIAVERRYKNPDGSRISDFFDCTAWRGTAEFLVQNFSKGKPVLVCGSLQNDIYKASDGTNRVTTKIAVDEVNFVGGREGSTTDNSQNTSTSENKAEISNSTQYPTESIPQPAKSENKPIQSAQNAQAAAQPNMSAYKTLFEPPKPYSAQQPQQTEASGGYVEIGKDDDLPF